MSFAILLPWDHFILLCFTSTLQNVTHPPMSFSILLPGDHLILHSFCLWPLVFRMLLHPTDAIFHSTPRRSVHPSILLSLTSTLQNVTPFHQCHFPYCSQEITQSFTPFSLHLYSLGCHPIPPVSFSILLPGDHPILQSFFPWPLLFRVSSHSTNAIFHTTPMRSPNPFTPFFLHIYSLGCHPIPPMSLSILLPEDHSILTFFFPWPLLFRMSPQSTKVIFHTTLRRSTHSSFLDIYSSEWHPTSFQCYLHTTLRRSPHPPLLFFFTATLQNVTPFYQSHFPHYSQVINPFFFPWPILFRMSPHTTNVIYILLSGDHPILHPFFSFTATLQNVTPFYQSHFPYYSQVINPFFFPWPPYSSECHPIPPMLFSILLSGDHPCHNFILFPCPLLFRMSSHSTNVIFHTTLSRSPHAIISSLFPCPLLFRMSSHSPNAISILLPSHPSVHHGSLFVKRSGQH